MITKLIIYVYILTIFRKVNLTITIIFIIIFIFINHYYYYCVNMEGIFGVLDIGFSVSLLPDKTFFEIS